MNKCVQTDEQKESKHKKAIKAVAIIILVFVLLFAVGIIGYKLFFKMTLPDALYNTSLTISNIGNGSHDKTTEEKIFTSIFAILCGIFFISLSSAVIGYVFTLYYEN